MGLNSRDEITIDTPDYYHEDYDSAILKAEVRRYNFGRFSGTNDITNYSGKEISISCFLKKDSFDNDGEFNGYGDIDEETGVSVQFYADDAEKLAHWLLEAVAEVRDFTAIEHSIVG